MSELTEERTQKQFDAAMLMSIQNPQLRAAMAGSPRAAGPPAIIGIAEEDSGSGAASGQKKLGTIASGSRGSQRPPSSGKKGASRNSRVPSESPVRRRPNSGQRDISNE